MTNQDTDAVSVTATELQQHPGRVFRRVLRGEHVRITNRGEHIATIVPAGEETPDA